MVTIINKEYIEEHEDSRNMLSEVEADSRSGTSLRGLDDSSPTLTTTRKEEIDDEIGVPIKYVNETLDELSDSKDDDYRTDGILDPLVTIQASPGKEADDLKDKIWNKLEDYTNDDVHDGDLGKAYLEMNNRPASKQADYYYIIRGSVGKIMKLISCEELRNDA